MNDASHLFEIVMLLGAAVVIVAIFRLIRLSPVIGYLAAGAAVGPFGIGLISDTTEMAGFAEVGVIFLLFLIGLELSFERLHSMRAHVFGFGGAQLIVTGGLLTGFLAITGSQMPSALIIGVALALSSTAIVLQVITEQGEKSSQAGRLAIAILILQDLAVIPLLVFISLLGGTDTSLAQEIMEVLLKAIACLAFIFIAGHLFLKPLFRFIASLENTELFSATALFIVLGMAWLTHAAGLSAALGAFMAGLLMAETEFKPQVEADILPFKGLLLGLFFMTVGISLNVTMLEQHFTAILGITVALMACKSLIVIGLSRLFGFSMSTAVQTGLLLSQGSEFAFILFTLAAAQGAIGGDTDQILLVVITMSMALTPLVAEAGRKIADTLEKRAGSRATAMTVETLDLSHHVIISGFGRVGHTVARLLEAERIGFVAIDMDSFLVARERKTGTPVYFGDTSRAHVLNALGLARARAVIITHSEQRVALATIGTIREISPDLPIIARAKNISQVKKLEAAGATLAVAEMFETSLQLGGALLRSLNVADHEISRIIELFRAEDYALAREDEKAASAPKA